jgi:hypothetical protein
MQFLNLKSIPQATAADKLKRRNAPLFLLLIVKMIVASPQEHLFYWGFFYVKLVKSPVSTCSQKGDTTGAAREEGAPLHQ